MPNSMSTVTVVVAVLAIVLNFYVIWNLADLYQTSNHDLSKSGLPRAIATAQNALLPPTTSKDEAGMIPLQLNIFEKDPLKDHALNVEVTLEGFRIIITGQYHVWASIEYEADKLCSQYDVKTWTLNVMVKRLSLSAYTPAITSWIVESADYICENKDVPIRENIYLDTIVSLMASDVVYVSVIPAAPLTNTSSSNYVGLHIINQG